MISNYLFSFNKESESYKASDSLIKYLDENYLDWRTLIVDPNEFVEFFKTGVHVYQNSWLKKLADEIFHIVSDRKSLIESVWNDVTINEWYRYAAIRKLVSIEPDRYLPIYIKELISGGFNLGGLGFAMIEELYDFPNSVEIVLQSNARLEGNNFEYLAQKACEYFEKYPQDVRKEILKNRDYFIRRDCNQALWGMMSAEEKLYLSAEIIANEYAKLHDVITFAHFLNNQDVYDDEVVLLTHEFRGQLEDVIRLEHHRGGLNGLHENHRFDCPEYDASTHQYTPSEQFSRFLSFAQTEDNELPYYLLNKAFQELRNSKYIYMS